MERIRELVDDYYAEKKTSPSIGKIATFMGCARSTIYRYLLDMSENGMIFYDGESVRTPIVADKLASAVTAPIVGAICCGEANVEFERIEGYVNLPDLYIMRARGDSMIDVGIDDNDLVVVEKIHTACVGDVVVALDENQQNTLKTYGGGRCDCGQVILRYEN